MTATAPRPKPPLPLPKDAVLVELRVDRLELETRQCLLPGTVIVLDLVMEGQSLRIEAPTTVCLVTDQDRSGYVYRSRVSFDGLSEGDRHLIRIFIAKGRGSPQLKRP